MPEAAGAANHRHGDQARFRLKFLTTLALLVVALISESACAQDAESQARVTAYWADWEYWSDPDFTHEKVDFGRVTHVNYAFAWNDASGTIYFTDRDVFGAVGSLGGRSFSGGPGDGPVKCSPPFWHPFSWFDSSMHAPVCQGWNDHNSGFVKSVHDDGAKAVLSIGGWTLSHEVSRMLEFAETRRNFVDNAAQLITDWGFDGIDLDFEYPGYAPHGGRAIDKANYVLLLRELRDRFDALESELGRDVELTAAVSCGPAIADAAYDYAQVTELLDYVNLMAYDLGGDWDPVAQHASPLYGYSGQINAGFDAAGCLAHWIDKGAPRNKTVLGAAHYGRSFGGATAIGEPSTGHDSAHWTGDTETRYYQIAEKIESDPSFHTAYDAEAGTHYGWFDGGGFISFEDTTSLATRSQYVLDQNLAGVLIWQLRGGMIKRGGLYEYPLLDAMLAVLGTPSGTPDSGEGSGSGGDGGDGDGSGNGGAAPPWSGASVAYQVGDLVSYEGHLYRVVLAHTSVSNWYPDSVWYFEVVGTAPDPDEGDSGSDNDGSDAGGGSGSTVPPWSGASVAYAVGDQVTYNDRLYRVVLAHTSVSNWYPDAVWYFEDIGAASDQAGGSGSDGGDDSNDDDGSETEPVPWSGASVDYEVDDLVTYEGRLYRVVLAHTSVSNWYPDAVWYFEDIGVAP